MKKSTIVVCDHIHQAGLDILANDENINFIMQQMNLKINL